MGDFEDIFGVGADIDEIISDIAASERQQHNPDDDIIEHRLWFPDFSAAEAWEKSHRGIGFTRRRSRGGFEVRLKDHWERRAFWRATVVGPADRATSIVSPIYPEAMSGYEVRHGAYALRLSETCTGVLEGLIGEMVWQTPHGLVGSSPFRFRRFEFEDFMGHISEDVSLILDLDEGMIAIFAKDHRVLIGRHNEDGDILVWPWILEIECGRKKSRKRSACFLCNHHGCTYGSVPTTFSHNRYFRLSFRKPKHMIANECHPEGVVLENLAKCIKDWIEILSPLDKRLDNLNRAPSCVVARKKVGSGLDQFCSVLACAVEVLRGGRWSVLVDLRVPNDDFDLHQFGQHALELQKIVAHQGPVWEGATPTYYPPPEMPRLTACHIPRDWLDCVDILPSELNEFKQLHSPWGVIAKGEFDSRGMSAHQRFEAEKLLKEVQNRSLPSYVDSFLKTATKL